MEYCGVFQSSLSQHSCIGYEGTPYGSATSHFLGGTATTYVTPQVFAEMPTPSSWHGENVISPGHWNYGYVHQTPIQNSRVQDGSTNLSEHYLENMPQHYGFQNLNRQSVFLIDGTEHSYYVLPENYSFERATSSTSPAMPTAEVNNSCQSFTSTRNGQISERETHPGMETQSIRDMLEQIQSKLQTMSENLRQDLKLMKSWETKRPAATQPNHLTQEAINVSDELPMYAVNAKEDNGRSIGFCSVLDTSLVNQEDGEGEPDTYPLDQATTEPVFDVYDDESDGCSTKPVRMFTDTPEQLTDQEEQHENRQASKCFSKPIFSLERPTVDTVDVFSLTDEQKPDNERIVVYANKALDNAFCEDVTSTHVPYVFVDVSIECSMRNNITKLPSLPDSELCDKHRKPEHGNNQQGNMLMTEMRRKEWDPGILNQVDMMPVLSASCRGSTENRLASQELEANISCNMAALTWHSSITRTQFLLLNSTNYTWDPGVLKFRDTTLDKSAVPRQVQFIQQTTELSFFSSEACIQHYAQDGVNPVLHGISLVLQRATHSSQDNYICSLYYKAEYCQMKCLWDFSISSRKRVQWDPGVKMYLHSWLDTFTAWSEIDKPLSCIHIPDLAVWPSQSAGRSASYIWDPGTMLLWYRSIWLLMFIEEKEMRGMIPEQWRLWFKVMHYPQISQKCEAMSSQLYWHEDIKFIGIAPWLISFNPP